MTTPDPDTNHPGSADDLFSNLSQDELRELYELLQETPEPTPPAVVDDDVIEAVMREEDLRDQVRELLAALTEERSETARLRTHATMMARRLADTEVRSIGLEQLLKILNPQPNPDD